MKIAITGGIACGKSVVSEILRRLGKTVYNADEINREMLSDKAYLEKLEKHFPEAFLNGRLDVAALRNTVFGSDEKREVLNSVAHPEILRRIATLDNCYVEVPLLFETGAEKLFDAVICVVAPLDVRIERIKKRNGFDEETSKKIIATQTSDDVRIAKSDFVIANDGDLSELEAKVWELANRFQI